MNSFDHILADIESREMALLEIERVLFTGRYGFSKKHKEIFSTQSISMIYSIWEGFIQQSFCSYIDELNRYKFSLFGFSDHIITHHMENNFKQFIDYPRDKISKKVSFFKKLQEFYSSETHTISRVVDTESNVGFKVLNKLLTTFSIEPFPEF